MMDFYSVSQSAKFLAAMKAKGWTVLGTNANAEDFRTYIDAKISPNDSKVILVLGSEGSGMSEEVEDACDAFLTVPGVSGRPFPETLVDSINVGTASGILVQELARKLNI